MILARVEAVPSTQRVLILRFSEVITALLVVPNEPGVFSIWTAASWSVLPTKTPGTECAFVDADFMPGLMFSK